MSDPEKELPREVFNQGLETFAQEATVKLFEEQVALHKRAAKVATEAVDLASQLAADGDPYKALIADSLKQNIAGGHARATGRIAASGSKEALSGDPFSPSSPGSGTSLPSTTNVTPKGLPQPEPVKRPRGRPRKNGS